MLPAYHFMSGVAAGMMASILTQPADVVKTHMQIGTVKHKTLQDTIVYIYKVCDFSEKLHFKIVMKMFLTLLLIKLKKKNKTF